MKKVETMTTNKDEILEELIGNLVGCDRAEEVIGFYKGIQTAARTAKEMINAGTEIENIHGLM